MAKIVCECSYVISDQTDYIREKAKFVADQDFEDFFKAVEKETSNDEELCISWDYLGDIFQCPNCGNIMIYSADYTRRCDFKPVNKEQCKNITLSCLGDNWKGFLRGHYSGAKHPLEYKRSKGELSWDTNKESGYICNMTLDELRKGYYEKFEELTTSGILRSSFLRINGEDEHTFTE